ncbi:MAG: alpha-2-macroglobulin family protein, partial [Rhodothermales bacterium]|nr:alpha-2-macroglobulin family protein [Rhodothermales bacterium]
MRFGRLHQITQIVQVPFTNKQLDLQLETFRDLLYPGAEEEWRLRVAGPQGEPVIAEMMASLYDASLDQFVPHDWQLNPFGFRSPVLGWRGGEWWDNVSASLQGPWNRGVAYRHRRYEALNLFGLERYLYSRTLGFAMARAPEAAAALAADGQLAEEVQLASDEARGKAGQGGDRDPAEERSEPGAGVVRTNFNETAFFFPDLVTDEDGETLLRFTIPEALTRWKLLALAHTPDVKIGKATATTETRKDVMITANAPRFLREGDSFSFAASVQNLSDSDLAGTAVLTILDAATMQPVDAEFSNDRPSVTFDLDPGQSMGVDWAITVPAGIDMVIYRVGAEAGEHRDGEQKPLPVLTNRMLVTESLPLPMRGPGIRKFSFDRLRDNRSPTLRHHAFSLEFTPNPVWYAVQALPYMMEFPHECSEQIFSRLYANSIAAHIVRQNPRIEQVFSRWGD